MSDVRDAVELALSESVESISLSSCSGSFMNKRSLVNETTTKGVLKFVISRWRSASSDRQAGDRQ